MKNRIWLFQLPFVFLFSFAYWVTESGVQGSLESVFLREKVYPALRTVSTSVTDRKFKLRGPTSSKNKIVVVEIDSPTLEIYGRWPWHRDVTAKLIEKTFEAGAKVVGLDAVFSEPDRRVPEELFALLEAQNMGQMADNFETDLALARTIALHKDKLVLGWTTENACQPLYSTPENCPVDHPDAIATHPQGFEKFAFTHATFDLPLNPRLTPVQSLATFIANLEYYNAFGEHSGYFNAFVDPDGGIRRTSLMMLANGKPYPSLPLEMARVGLGEDLSVRFDRDFKIRNVSFAKSGRALQANEQGVVEVNFRGPHGHAFPYVSATDILSEDDVLQDELNRKLAGASKKEVLKDAYVLIGLTALGVYDMRNFPFESAAPGVEGHAQILDNVLTGDFLVRGGDFASWIMLAMMTLGALGFAYATQRLESVPALLLFLVVFSGLGVADVKLLFSNNVNWETSFLYLELFTIFVCTIAAKYVFEERSKKFVRGAFAKYVAPAVVDSIMKDPTKLTVGGEKRDITIMFSDIRGFTTFSERMDAKALSSFLNDYLGIMTKIVFSTEGTLDKYIGDAIMAFWGAPLDQAKHASNACRAGILMMQALEENRERFRTQYGVDVHIGIGINTGVVSVGNMGSSNNFSYTVIGDHVNLASRLEGLTKAYGVSIVTTRFAFEQMLASGAEIPPHRILDFVKVKGKKNAVELIQVLPREYAAEGLKLFDEGRALYQAQKWDEAAAKFREANDKLATVPGELDGPCGVYLERCTEFKANPPGGDWDGSWEMHSK